MLPYRTLNALSFAAKMFSPYANPAFFLSLLPLLMLTLLKLPPLLLRNPSVLSTLLPSLSKLHPNKNLDYCSLFYTIQNNSSHTPLFLPLATSTLCLCFISFLLSVFYAVYLCCVSSQQRSSIFFAFLSSHIFFTYSNHSIFLHAVIGIKTCAFKDPNTSEYVQYMHSYIHKVSTELEPMCTYTSFPHRDHIFLRSLKLIEFLCMSSILFLLFLLLSLTLSISFSPCTDTSIN